VAATIILAITRFDLYSPELEQAGLVRDGTLYVEATEDTDVLALMEDRVRHGSLAVLVCSDPTADTRLVMPAST
jgi:protein ImuA